MTENSPFPPHIRKIAIVAPAGAAAPEAVSAGLAVLKQWGVVPVVMPGVFSNDTNAAAYLSSGTAERCGDLHRCWNDTDIDLVMCTRGGFGSAHLLPELDWQLLCSRRLPFVGYSDITALQLAMYKYGAGPIIAGPMCVSMGKTCGDKYTFHHFSRALDDSCPPRRLTLPDGGQRLTVLCRGEALAPVAAINLAVAASLCGTAWMPDLTGHILLIEDIAEPVYKLDRYLTQLEQSGILPGLAGLLFGNFTDCGNVGDMEKLFRSFGEKHGLPTRSGFPFGHSQPFTPVRQGRKMEFLSDGGITC